MNYRLGIHIEKYALKIQTLSSSSVILLSINSSDINNHEFRWHKATVILKTKSFKLINWLYSLLCKVTVYIWAKPLRLIEQLKRKKKNKVTERLNCFLESSLTWQERIIPVYFFYRMESLQNPGYDILSDYSFSYSAPTCVNLLFWYMLHGSSETAFKSIYN